MAQHKFKKVLEFEGLMTAPFTAFKENGDVNDELIPKYVKYLMENNVTGAFVNGTSGEALSMTVNERKRTAEKWIKAGKDYNMNLVVIHISANCIMDTKELARHAEENCADAIAILPPFYYRPNNNKELIEYMSEISASAPNTPMMYYHIPSMTHVQLNLNDFVSEAIREIPNFIGCKYTNSDLKDMVNVQANHGSYFKLMLGCDELFLAALACGVTCSIGITHNMMSRINYKIFQCFKEKKLNEAWANQMELNKILNKLLKWGNIFQVLKVAMNNTTPINVGKLRLPICNLRDNNLNGLLQDIKTANL